MKVYIHTVYTYTWLIMGAFTGSYHCHLAICPRWTRTRMLKAFLSFLLSLLFFNKEELISGFCQKHYSSLLPFQETLNGATSKLNESKYSQPLPTVSLSKILSVTNSGAQVLGPPGCRTSRDSPPSSTPCCISFKGFFFMAFNLKVSVFHHGDKR